jgi:dolichol-phosphate mannosyltransferase
MFEIWRKGKADIVEGVKKERGRESLSYKLGAKFFYKIFSRITGHQLDNATDFKLLDSKVVDALLQMGEVNRFFRGMTAWLGFRSKQLEFEVHERVGGTTGWSPFKLFKLSLTAFTAFSTLPLHLVTFFGFIFLILSFFLGIQTLYNKMSGTAVTGFATVILLLLIMGSFLMISLGIIGEYLARIYKEVKGRPHYIAVEKIERHGEKLK